MKASNDIRIHVEVKRVKWGKKVTIIKLDGVSEKEKETVLKFLKKRLGTGGTIKNGDLILQGDMSKKVFKVMTKWLLGDQNQESRY